MTNDLTKEHARKVLEADKLRSDTVAAMIRELESSGHRVVDGGQTGNGESGQTWEMTDWRTGEVLVQGVGYDAYETAGADLDPDDMWIHIDRIGDDLETTIPATPGVPASLAGAIEEWIGSLSTPDEDIAEWVGWDVEKVRGHR